MSTSTQDVKISTRKRDHSEFTKSDENAQPRAPTGLFKVFPPLSDNSMPIPYRSNSTEKTGLTTSTEENNQILTRPVDLTNSPDKCSPGLTESGSSPPEGNTPSPTKTPARAPLKQSTLARFTTNAPPAKPSKTQTAKPASSTSTPEPATKRTKLSPEEKAAKEAADAERKKEREALQAAKAAELAKLEAEKAQKAAERELKKKEKEEAEKQKAAQKAAKEAEKAAKEAEKAAKEAEKIRKAEEKEAKRREKEEEEAKKARSQKKLTSMFKITAPPTPKKENAVPKLEKKSEVGATDATAGPAKVESLYETTFKPFYIKDGVKIADNLFVDKDTCEAKTKILDEWVEGKRGEFVLGPFNPREALELLVAPVPRGRVYPKVSKIMAEYHGASTSTAPVSESQIRHTREALKSVPVKSLKFREDVRPPYIGTVSGLPTGVLSLEQIARNPLRKDVLPLNYDYDSEAEWIDDDGEDVDELDDEEEDADSNEDMDDFLDDSEDAGPARLLFSGGMEPVSSGICWENDKWVNGTTEMDQYRLELIPEHLEKHASIDPWSGEYFLPRGKDKSESKAPSANQLSSSTPAAQIVPSAGAAQSATGNTNMAPPPVPSDAFQALNSKATDKKPAQKLPADAQEELKDFLRLKPDLSKVGVIEVFHANHKKKFPKTQIKASFEDLTEKAGKHWRLKG
ncbi:chromatin assembly factor 1 subunit rlf2 [Rhypophila sp. PSN 637]